LFQEVAQQVNGSDRSHESHYIRASFGMMRIIPVGCMDSHHLPSPEDIALYMAKKKYHSEFRFRHGDHFPDDISEGLEYDFFSPSAMSKDEEVDHWGNSDIGYALLYGQISNTDLSSRVEYGKRGPNRFEASSDVAYPGGIRKSTPSEFMSRLNRLNIDPMETGIPRLSVSDSIAEYQPRKNLGRAGLGYQETPRKYEEYVNTLKNHYLRFEPMIVWKQLKRAYRDFFRSRGPAFLSKKGQQMSLPLSWVALSAITTSAVYSLSTDANHLLWQIGRLHSDIDHDVIQTNLEVAYVPERFRRVFGRNPTNGWYVINGRTPHVVDDPVNQFIRGLLEEFKQEPILKCHRCEIDKLRKSLEGNDNYEKAQHLVQKRLGVNSVTLGDDATHGTQTMGQLNQIRSFVEDFGGEIHPIKDVVSNKNRYVIGEYLVKDDVFVERIRPSMIVPAAQPKHRWKYIRNMESSPIFYYLPDNEKNLVESMVYQFNRKNLKKYESEGLPLYVPREFGGIGMKGLMTNRQVDCFYEFLSFSAEEVSSRLDELVQSTLKRPNNAAWKAASRELLIRVKFGGVGLSRKEYNNLVNSKLQKYLFMTDGRESQDMEIELARLNPVWVPRMQVMTPKEYYTSVQMQQYLLDLVRSIRNSLAYVVSDDHIEG